LTTVGNGDGGASFHVLRLKQLVHRADPLADAVADSFATLPPGHGRRMLNQALEHGIDTVARPPEPLRALFAQLDYVPFWIDWDTIERGGVAYRRAGPICLLTQACYALPLAYASGAGVKPMIFSGRLVHRSTRRLAETGYFINQICQVGALTRFSAGFAAIVRVRMMHAQIRRLVLRSGMWQGDAWGAPVNQIEMAATNLFLSALLLDGLRRLGMRIGKSEMEDALHTLRYVGYLIGVQDDLLCATEAEARRLADLVIAVRLQPDDDSRALVHALMQKALPELLLQRAGGLASRRARLISHMAYGVSESFIGSEWAQRLGYPRTLWRLAAPALIRLVVWPTERLLRPLFPGATTHLLDRLMRLLAWDQEQALASEPARFEMPSALASADRSNPSQADQHGR
jgi:ER-bound oxygenase mpaB/B'/Rubber oxygenase, catalytic domain